MYRTRSFMRRCMARTVKLKRARSQPCNTLALRRKQLFRRQRRRPAVLQSSLIVGSNRALPDGGATAPVSPIAESEYGVARLSTHIWHSKRFFMSRCHGWIVPEKLRNRGLKAVDCLLKQCTLQDVSYHSGLIRASATSNIHEGGASATVSSVSLHGSMEQLQDLLGQFTVSQTMPRYLTNKQSIIIVICDVGPVNRTVCDQ